MKIMKIKYNESETDISKPDSIPNLLSVSSLLKLDGKPEVSDMVINLWHLAHSMRSHIIQNDDSLARNRLIKMVKYVLPLIADVVPQVGKINTTRPTEYNEALLALNKILEEYNESV